MNPDYDYSPSDYDYYLYDLEPVAYDYYSEYVLAKGEARIERERADKAEAERDDARVFRDAHRARAARLEAERNEAQAELAALKAALRTVGAALNEKA